MSLDYTAKETPTSSTYPGSIEAIMLFLDPCCSDNESVIKEALELADNAGLTEAKTSKDDSLKMFDELRSIVDEVYARRNAAENGEH